MLIDAEDSCLLAIDLQERLVPALHDHQRLIANCVWLLKIARRLGIPVLMSEQYPKGLGHVVSELQEFVPDDGAMEKVCFSCGADESCMERIDATERDQLVLIGVEAHVCVLQSALELLDCDKEVYVVADCVASRDPRNAELALTRMRDEGAVVVSREMVVFEWLQRAGTERFREISREFLR